ncbi:3-isopropylmalate dehydratase small subunit [Streptomyces sp. NPDC007901]|uniref:3-isopropylmalate dehydratase small subunit n=1 Tax=Streptomyces sp. NPDC007901 TaxID=3364785 RepID=UPI0036EC7F0A
MRSFTAHTGTAAPLRRSNVDTDQIIPGRYCATHRRTGYADGLFGDWRQDPGFVLNRPAHQGASILVAGEMFGTGSSREHAVWALQEFGFRVVIAPRFADIFRANSLMAGLLTVTLPRERVDALWETVEGAPDTEITVDLREMSVSAAGITDTFTLGADTRARLLAGLDQIDATLGFVDDIAAYEHSRRPGLPTSGTAA